MEAGRELDALIAEKVFGWTELEPIPSERLPFNWSVCKGFPPGEHTKIFCRPYSRHIKDAWEVVEKLLGRFQFTLNSPEDGLDWYAEFGAWNAKIYQAHDATAKAVPHAICLAALKAVELATTNRVSS